MSKLTFGKCTELVTLWLVAMLGSQGLLPAQAPSIVVAVIPEEESVRAASQRQFHAIVSGTQDRRVTWSVNGVPGGSPAAGVISADGMYTAPPPPTPPGVVVTASSVASAAAKGHAGVRLLNPIPKLADVEPNRVNTGRFSLALSGSDFVRGVEVLFGETALATNYVSSSQLTASGETDLPVGSLAMVTVVNPEPGSASSYPKAVTVLAPVDVNIAPSSSTLRAGETVPFRTWVINSADKSVRWFVNGVEGGNTVVGTVNAEGVYQTPAMPPVPNSVTVTVRSAAAPQAFDQATVTVLNPVPTVESIQPGRVAPGPFAITVRGAGFAQGAQVSLGSNALDTAYVSTTQLLAAGSAPVLPGGLGSVTVVNPEPGSARSAVAALRIEPDNPAVSATAAVRFLEQTSWGATPGAIARVQRIGFAAYLDEQFAAPPSGYPDPPSQAGFLIPAQQRFFVNAVQGTDQLRQRVAYALGKIFVISGRKVHTSEQFLPFLRLVEKSAFINFRTLLEGVTLSPSMGVYLDLVRNEKASSFLKAAPNENYARELLQLFTIGPYLLRADGMPREDINGQPIPSYNQTTVENLARALTGWTFPTKPGAAPQLRNPPYFEGFMEPSEELHDTGEKTLLNGVVLPAGQTTRQDLSQALDNIFEHPNVAPFVARRLIQDLVTSNPSRAYVARVAAVFNGNDGGVRGDLRAAIRAIVLDEEARRGDLPGMATAEEGHLKEPVLFMTGLVRALGAEIAEKNNMTGLITPAGQSLFYPPSVFGHFSPDQRLPGSELLAPEFGIFTPSTAVYRLNLASMAAFAPGSAGVSLDLSPFEHLAGNVPLLVEALNRALLGGRITAEMRQIVGDAVLQTSEVVPRMRAQVGLYLVASSSQYQVQR